MSELGLAFRYVVKTYMSSLRAVLVVCCCGITRARWEDRVRGGFLVEEWWVGGLDSGIRVLMGPWAPVIPHRQMQAVF